MTYKNCLNRSKLKDEEFSEIVDIVIDVANEINEEKNIEPTSKIKNTIFSRNTEEILIKTADRLDIILTSYQIQRLEFRGKTLEQTANTFARLISGEDKPPPPEKSDFGDTILPVIILPAAIPFFLLSLFCDPPIEHLPIRNSNGLFHLFCYAFDPEYSIYFFLIYIPCIILAIKLYSKIKDAKRTLKRRKSK